MVTTADTKELPGRSAKYLILCSSQEKKHTGLEQSEMTQLGNHFYF